jgi:hypothetical protein
MKKAIKRRMIEAAPKIAALFLVLTLLSSSAISQSMGVIAIDPADTTVDLNNTFDMDIVVDSNMSELKGFNFQVTFDPAILNVDTVLEGSLIRAGGPSFWIWRSIVPDIVEMNGAILGPSLVVDGPGVLATITFEAIGYGVSPVAFASITLFTQEDSLLHNIPYASTDGIVRVGAPTATATIDFDPNTLNLKSKGKWVTVYIELPESYDVACIDLSSVMLNDSVPAEERPIKIDDYDSDDIPDLMVKFDRASVQDILSTGEEVEITVTGKLTDGTLFSGIDTIRVIKGGKSRASLSMGIMSQGSISVNILALYQNYPNPFSSETEISFFIEQTGKVDLTIYNVVGQAIKTLVNQVKSAGSYTVRWDGKDKTSNDVAPGIYFCRLVVQSAQDGYVGVGEVSSHTFIKKMILVR